MNGQGPAGETEGFDLTAWLDVGTGTGASPGETTTVLVADETGSATSDPAHEGFAFADWIADGSGGLELPPAQADDNRAPMRSTDDLPTVPHAIPPSYRPAIHPTMVATVALFLTAATLAVLTVGGVLPPLGPTTGLLV